VTITVNGRDFFAPAPTTDGVSHDAAPAESALAYANAINAISGETGVTAEATTTHTAAGDQTANNHATVDGTNYLKINGVDVGTFNLVPSGIGGSDVVDAINAVFGQTGVKATLNTNKITLTAEDGRNIGIDADGTGALVSGFADGAGVEDLTRGTVTFSSIQTFSVADTAAVLGIGGAANGVKNSAKNINTIDISTKTGAEQAIQIVDVGLANLNGLRANIGAQVSRLNTTISNLSIAAENVQASNSRILDADFAAETAELTRTQILQQAAIAVLSQANQVPQLVLSLLQ